mmetsp:Transcript_32757/g.71409  ORF Transcript_32757/g.71409 Transcript_32757/m.71409 type:complete len:213 (+) Transcript_32757:1293-1931(+)
MRFGVDFALDHGGVRTHPGGQRRPPGLCDNVVVLFNLKRLEVGLLRLLAEHGRATHAVFVVEFWVLARVADLLELLDLLLDAALECEFACEVILALLVQGNEQLVGGEEFVFAGFLETHPLAYDAALLPVEVAFNVDNALLERHDAQVTHVALDVAEVDVLVEALEFVHDLDAVVEGGDLLLGDDAEFLVLGGSVPGDLGEGGVPLVGGVDV